MTGVVATELTRLADLLTDYAARMREHAAVAGAARDDQPSAYSPGNFRTCTHGRILPGRTLTTVEVDNQIRCPSNDVANYLTYIPADCKQHAIPIGVCDRNASLGSDPLGGGEPIEQRRIDGQRYAHAGDRALGAGWPELHQYGVEAEHVRGVGGAWLDDADAEVSVDGCGLLGTGDDPGHGGEGGGHGRTITPVSDTP